MEIILSHPERINLFTQSFPGFFLKQMAVEIEMKIVVG